MSLNTLLFFIIVLFTSCNRQGASKSLNDKNSVAPGDTVEEISRSALIIFQDKNNNYWFGSDGQGVYRYDGRTIIHFSTKDGLCHNQIRNIQEDKSGNIYINTPGGISKFDGRAFTTLIPASSEEWKTQAGDLWFTGAQDSGVVYRYDGKTLYRLEFPETIPGEEFKSRFPRSKYPNMTFSPYDVYSIYKDSKGNLWFGTSNLGVCRYDPSKSGKFFTWISEDGLDASPVRSICEDKHENLWFGNSGQAVYRYDPSAAPSGGNNLVDFRKEKGIGNLKDNPKDFPVSYMSMVQDNDGALWIATYSCGVWRISPSVSPGADEGTITHYPIMDEEKLITLYSIYKDKRGDLWLGTHEAGAYKFNGKTFEKL